MKHKTTKTQPSIKTCGPSMLIHGWDSWNNTSSSDGLKIFRNMHSMKKEDTDEGFGERWNLDDWTTKPRSWRNCYSWLDGERGKESDQRPPRPVMNKSEGIGKRFAWRLYRFSKAQGMERTTFANCEENHENWTSELELSERWYLSTRWRLQKNVD